MRRNGVRFIIHYLDDFLLVGSPGSNQCAEAVSLVLRILDQLGVPVACMGQVGRAHFEANLPGL